jgi:hypothetical protein
MSGTPDEKPQRATAAQLASRKIKDIRRRPRGTTPTGGAGEPSGAFSQLSSTPAFSTSSFSAPANQPGVFSFGQSQSFPGATAPSQPSQGQATPFSFGGNGSTSFNFSGPFGASTNNPFANNPFTAANSAPAQPTPPTGTPSFGGFGNQPTPQPAFSFGAAQSAAQNASSPVGTGLFGQPAATNATAGPVADSMQTSPDSQSKTPFGASVSSFPTKNVFGDSGASGLFSPKPTAPAGTPFGGLSLPPAEKPAPAPQAPTTTSQA